MKLFSNQLTQNRTLDQSTKTMASKETVPAFPDEKSISPNDISVPVSSRSSDDIDLEAKSGDYGSGREHIFSDPLIAEHWRSIYENAHYEGRHRFDPEFVWSAEEEKKVLRKIDLRIISWAWMMFMALDLNRRNINRGMFCG